MHRVHKGTKSQKPQPSCLTKESEKQLDYLPDKLRAKLLPFQKEGVMFALKRDGRCMVADEMGLGKTIQAIAIAYFYKEEWPLLIVVPSSLRYPWTEEIEKWIPELGPEEIIVIQNKTDVGRISTSKVAILGYGLLTADAETLIDALNNQNFKVVIVDESHYMKSRNASRSKILLPLVQKARRAILLTGTPALGRPEELFMQIEALFPKKFGTWTEYSKRYCNAHVRYFGKRAQWDCRGASNLNELHRLLSDIMIRRLKNDVLTQLPPKIRQRISFDLPATAAKELNTSLEEWERLMRASNSRYAETGSDSVQIMGLITHLFKQTAIAKAGAVKDYIKVMLQNESLKFLVFAHHLSMLQACTEAVIENKTRYIRIDGSVPSSERIHLVNQFQKDPDTRVAILSIQAAGQGLTFTAATHIVFAELYWDPGHIKQAEDRAHRIGQCSSVNIHYLVANGTLDTFMWGMLNRKAQVTGSTLNGRKEKLQAEEGDKEKWDFLQFAEAWTPNESSEELKNEALFTHFEKEKQRDIRSFFSPKLKKGQLVTSCEESRLFHENSTLEASGSGKIAAREITECQSDPQREAKRLKLDVVQDHCHSQVEKPFLPRQIKSLHMEGTPEAKAQPATPSHPEKEWECGFCTYINNSALSYCEMCENPQSSTDGLRHTQSENKNGTGDCQKDSSREVGTHLSCENQVLAQPTPELLPEDQEDQSETEGGKEFTPQPEALKNSEALPVYDILMFCASKNTDRIHVYTKDGKPMNCNFIPLDIKLDLWEDLPANFQLKQNRSLILRFVREWSSLTAMKQRIIRKSDKLFYSPILAFEEITKQHSKQNSTKRYITKDDVAAASIDKVKTDGGHVRLITKNSQDSSTKKFLGDGACVPFLNTCMAQVDPIVKPSTSKGYLQAVDNEGNPLCLRCQQPTCQAEQEGKVNAWDSRFCSLKCQEEFWIRSNNGFLRAKVFETEHGVCQLCNLNAQELFLRLRDAPKSQRKNLLDITWISKLSIEQLNDIVRSPVEGHFWQVDHIKPVYSGGGQCSLDNFQTLCTVCHKERTASQARERSQVRRQALASKHGSDITRFLVKNVK